MENNNEHNIKKGHFDAFVHAVGAEIEQAQVRLITCLLYTSDAADE